METSEKGRPRSVVEGLGGGRSRREAGRTAQFAGKKKFQDEDPPPQVTLNESPTKEERGEEREVRAGKGAMGGLKNETVRSPEG